MGKIKGWKKIKNKLEWEQDNYKGIGIPQRIFIVPYGDRWLVDGGWWNATTKTKQGAIYQARKMMRLNPNG